MRKIIVIIGLCFMLMMISVVAILGNASQNTNGVAVDLNEEGEINSEIYVDYEPNGESEIGNLIVKNALLKLGAPYVWGNEGPHSFDCSGLVFWACRESGVDFTRTTASVLSTMGENVNLDDLQPGDIITFKTVPSYVSHVAIYIGDGKMVHAPNKNTVVRVDNFMTSAYWQNILYNCRRIY